ncbi:MAG TPA: GIDE domain-containing protein [Terriglobales bacterium]|nr:GIDE domain-containing protein [Terriglobales bacterium]
MDFLPAIPLVSSSDPTAAALIGACVGVYLFYRGFKLLQRRRLIMNIPASKVRSASLGLVEVSGLAIGPYTLPAPITCVPCYYYRTQAWELRQSGKDKEWHKVADESLHLPFYLDDNTGRVLIDPRGAEMDLHRDFHQEYHHALFSSDSGMPAPVSGFLARHSISGDRPIKIDEYCIKPKNALFVLGTLAENPGLAVSPVPVSGNSTHGFNIQLPETVSPAAARVIEALPGLNIAWGTAGPDSSISSTNPSQSGTTVAPDPATQEKIAAAMIKAGITNPAAWAVAGLSQPGSMNPADKVDSATNSGEFDTNPKTVLMKGQNNPAFFISWRSQREVAQSLGWRSALMIWGGPALTLICLYILAARFGWL